MERSNSLKKSGQSLNGSSYAKAYFLFKANSAVFIFCYSEWALFVFFRTFELMCIRWRWVNSKKSIKSMYSYS